MNTHLGTVDGLRALPLERALQYTSVGMAACDAEGRLTVLSPVLQQILGHDFAPVTEDEYAGAGTLVDEHGRPLPLDALPLVRARRGEFVRDELLIARRADGRLRPPALQRRAARGRGRRICREPSSSSRT